jgi:hypothetical protein
MRKPTSLAESCRTIIRNDWAEFKTPVFFLTFIWLAPLVLIWRGVYIDLARGMASGSVVCAPFMYARASLYYLYRRDALKSLLAPPMTPIMLVLTKYASAFSMTVFTINLGAPLLGDLRLILYANVAGLFITTLFMAPSVISRASWVHLIPLWTVLLLVRPVLQGNFEWLAANATLLTAVALVSIPIMVLFSAQIFALRHA